MPAFQQTDIERIEGIEYAAPGGYSLQLDLYRPAEHSTWPTPTVLYLHGGGMVIGRRDDFPGRLYGLASRGIAVASASYRLAGTATYPAQLQDARAAVRWLRRSGSAYGLATERLGIWGASGGATLALLAAYAPPADSDDDGDSSIQAAVSWFCVSDQTERADIVRPAEGTTMPSHVIDIMRRDGLDLPPRVPLPVRLLGVANMDEARPRLPEISPITYAGRPGPPALLMHGTADGMVPSEQSIWFSDAVITAGGDARLLLLHGANHEDPAFHRPEALGAVASFLHEQLQAGR